MEVIDYRFAGLDMNPAIPGAHVWNDNEANETTAVNYSNKVTGYCGVFPQSFYTQIASII